jgi:Zn-dependent alcohol dehydrogenase
MSSLYSIACKAIVVSDQHTWTWTDLLTRPPLEDEFLVEMIATGVCHTDIFGYGGIYPRVLGHEGMHSLSYAVFPSSKVIMLM